MSVEEPDRSGAAGRRVRPPGRLISRSRVSSSVPGNRSQSAIRMPCASSHARIATSALSVSAQMRTLAATNAECEHDPVMIYSGSLVRGPESPRLAVTGAVGSCSDTEGGHAFSFRLWPGPPSSMPSCHRGGLGVPASRARRRSVALDRGGGSADGRLWIWCFSGHSLGRGHPRAPIPWRSGDLPVTEPRWRRGPRGAQGPLGVGPALEEGRERAAVGGKEWPGIGPRLGGRAEDGRRVVTALRGEEAEFHAVECQGLAVLEVLPEALTEASHAEPRRREGARRAGEPRRRRRSAPRPWLRGRPGRPDSDSPRGRWRRPSRAGVGRRPDRPGGPGLRRCGPRWSGPRRAVSVASARAKVVRATRVVRK